MINYDFSTFTHLCGVFSVRRTVVNGQQSDFWTSSQYRRVATEKTSSERDVAIPEASPLERYQRRIAWHRQAWYYQW